MKPCVAETKENLPCRIQRKNKLIISGNGQQKTSEGSVLTMQEAKVGDLITLNNKDYFTDYIKEEFKRRKNETGKFSTVQLGINESSFCADDDFNSGICKYERISSEQLNQLRQFNGKTLDQNALIEMILRLKPSLLNYGEIQADEDGSKRYYSDIFATYSKLKISRNAQMNMNPVFGADGESDNSYTCTFRLTSGANSGTDEDVKIPEGFYVSCPFVKAGKHFCTFYVDIQPINDGGQVYFSVKVPNYETEIEQAIINESDVIKSSLTEYPELLVLADL